MNYTRQAGRVLKNEPRNFTDLKLNSFAVKSLNTASRDGVR
jgi:hypothetical protein